MPAPLNFDPGVKHAIQDAALSQKRQLDQIQRTLNEIVTLLERIAGPQS